MVELKTEEARLLQGILKECCILIPPRASHLLHHLNQTTECISKILFKTVIPTCTIHSKPIDGTRTTGRATVHADIVHHASVGTKRWFTFQGGFINSVLISL